MDDIQKRADNKAWDKKQDRRISDLNRKIEAGLNSESLTPLYGLHITPDDEVLNNVDETSEVDDQQILRDNIVRRFIQLEDAISRNRDLPGPERMGYGEV
jgi:hypothetical protein